MSKLDFLLDLTELQFLLEWLPQGELTKAIEDSKNEGEYLAKGTYPTGKYLLKISNEQAEVIQEELSVLLTVKGLGDDGEPNSIGFLIENLIDRFSDD